MSKFIKTGKRFILLCGFLFMFGVSWKMIELRRHSGSLSVVAIKMLDLRLDLIEDALRYSSGNIVVKKGGRVQGTDALKSLLVADQSLEWAAWVHGNGRDSVAYERTSKGTERFVLDGSVRRGPLALAHQRGQVVVSPLESSPSQIPVFYVSYPLDRQEGGFVMVRVNLWDFLKPPASNMQELLGGIFDFELRDQEGNLLAHQTSRDSWSKTLGRFFVARTLMNNLGLDAQVRPNRAAFVESFRSGHYIAVVLVLAAAFLSLI
ncbi:MAG: hypothetical protein HY547_01905 [Elusimicrobia bacterium]|nr:hypothetical protein [Elusimicrobiota bacterium]